MNMSCKNHNTFIPVVFTLCIHSHTALPKPAKGKGAARFITPRETVFHPLGKKQTFFFRINIWQLYPAHYSGKQLESLNWTVHVCVCECMCAMS